MRMRTCIKTHANYDLNRDLNSITSFQHYFLSCFARSIALHPLRNFGGQSDIEPYLEDQELYCVEYVINFQKKTYIFKMNE